MNEVKLIFRFLGISIKQTYKIPDKISDLSSKQYMALVKFLHGGIKEYKVISHIYNIPSILAWIIARSPFWIYNLIISIEILGDLRKSCDHFLINRLPGTKLYCENHRFKGITFMQFMFADTMYTEYLKNQNNTHLYSFIAALYLKQGEVFNDVEIDKRLNYISNKKIDNITLEAILLNYMMMKKWLSETYSYMFSSIEKDGSDSPKQQQRWLDIFDSFVGEQIPDTNYFKDMPCMDAFRIINRRLKDYYNGPK